MPKPTPSKSALLDAPRAERIVTELMSLPGPPGHEWRVAQFIIDQLIAAGVKRSAIKHDQAHRRSGTGGDSGNMAVRLPASPGRRRQRRRLLMAHMDTVPLAVGCLPVRRGGRIVSADKRTALGADDRAGCAAVLVAAIELLERGLPHPPLTFLWTVQEEVGLVGARNLTPSLLSKPKLGFNFDGGKPGDMVIGATGATRMTIHVAGVAAHAGAHPERGVSAITIAGLAIERLQRDGWLGAVEKSRQRGTSNIGVIEGGAATNVVTDAVTLRAEARSHNVRFRARIVKAYRDAFAAAAKSVRNESGQGGKVTVKVRDDYESFALSEREPVVAAAAAAMRSLRLEPNPRIIDGGLDANWMTAHGVPTVTLGVGQQQIHTVKEYLDLRQFVTGCEVALRLAQGDEDGVD